MESYRGHDFPRHSQDRHLENLQHSLSCFLPCEITKGRIAANIRFRGLENQVDEDAWKLLLQRVKSNLEVNKNKKGTQPLILEFPSDPREFARAFPDLYNTVYADEGPGLRCLPELDTNFGVGKSHGSFASLGQHLALSLSPGKQPLQLGTLSPRGDHVDVVKSLFGPALAQMLAQGDGTLFPACAMQPMQHGMTVGSGAAWAKPTFGIPSSTPDVVSPFNPASGDSSVGSGAACSSHGFAAGQALLLHTAPKGIASSTISKPTPTIAPATEKTGPAEDDDSLDGDVDEMRAALRERANKKSERKAKVKDVADEDMNKAPHTAVFKRPASAKTTPVAAKKVKSDLPLEATSTAKPTGPLPKPLTGPQGTAPCFYRAAKIAISTSKGGYRVFTDLSKTNPADTVFKWTGGDKPDSRALAWKKVLAHIDAKRST